jgi:hypothetical protein
MTEMPKDPQWTSPDGNEMYQVGDVTARCLQIEWIPVAGRPNQKRAIFEVCRDGVCWQVTHQASVRGYGASWRQAILSSAPID